LPGLLGGCWLTRLVVSSGVPDKRDLLGTGRLQKQHGDNPESESTTQFDGVVYYQARRVDGKSSGMTGRKRMLEARGKRVPNQAR